MFDVTLTQRVFPIDADYDGPNNLDIEFSVVDPTTIVGKPPVYKFDTRQEVLDFCSRMGWKITHKHCIEYHVGFGWVTSETED